MATLKNNKELKQILEKANQFRSLYDAAKDEMVGVSKNDIFHGVHVKDETLLLELIVENPDKGDFLHYKEIKIQEFESLTGVSPFGLN